MSTRDNIADIPAIPGMDRLPHEAAPARDLWPEIEARLSRPIGRPVPVRGRTSLLLRLAAALLLFASGVAVGRSSVTAPPVSSASRIENPIAPAAEVQRAGTEYVAALAALRNDPRAEVRGQGREAAFAAMFGAAHELVRLTPEDDTESEVLSAVSRVRGQGGVRRAVHF
jgi:hypothetical protein